MQKIIKYVNSNIWVDSRLKYLNIDFENIILSIIDDSGYQTTKLICKNYIGYECVGHWDESLIEKIEIKEKGEFIDRSIKIVKFNYGNNTESPGMIKKITDKWFQLNIKLIDGEFIKIACKDVEIKTIDLRIKV